MAEKNVINIEENEDIKKRNIKIPKSKWIKKCRKNGHI